MNTEEIMNPVVDEAAEEVVEIAPQKEFNVFESIQIGLASPEKILSWSHGEV